MDGYISLSYRPIQVPWSLEAVIEPTSADITRLLQQWSDGDPVALDRLVPLVYDRLRQLARRRLRGQAADRSLNTTALVHEAYLKLVDARQARFQDRAHFLAVASRVMRQLLIDHARARQAAKRGGGHGAVELDESLWIHEGDLDVVTELDEALTRLAALDRRQSEMLEQHYFGGLSIEETAIALGVSPATVKRELRSARAWLAAELGKTGGSES
jgi:RNA polymerase sigma factor (TIGR02999 family)